MKTLCSYLTPMLIVALLAATSPRINASPNTPPPGTIVKVYCMNNGKKVEIANIDLSNVVADENGNYTVNQTVEIDGDGMILTNGVPVENMRAPINTNGNSGFFLTEVSNNNTNLSNITNILATFQYQGYSETNDSPPVVGGFASMAAVAPTPNACIGYVIGVLVLIVGCIIIYLLIKTCKKCLK